MLKHFPRLTTIILSYAAAFIVFALLGAQFFHDLIVPFGIAGIFIAGALYTFSFTASIGAIILVALAPYYPPGFIAVIGGMGALFADALIFNFIQHDLKKEVERIARSVFICNIGAKGIFCQNWFRNFLGALIIASPLPDELGIALMSTAKISKENFALVTFIMDILGIYALVGAVSFFL